MPYMLLEAIALLLWVRAYVPLRLWRWATRMNFEEHLATHFVQCASRKDRTLFPLLSSTVLRLLDELPIKRSHSFFLLSMPIVWSMPVTLWQKHSPFWVMGKFEKLLVTRLLSWDQSTFNQQFPLLEHNRRRKYCIWLCETRISDHVLGIFLAGTVWI